MKKLKATILALLLLAIVALPDVSAQEAGRVSKVSFENGHVYVNGKEVDMDELPKSLREPTRGIHLQFWTDDNSYIEINGIAYTVADGTLVEADGDLLHHNNMTVFFSSEKEDYPIRLFRNDPVMENYMVRIKNAGNAYESYVEAFNARAVEFDNLRFQIDAIRAPETASIARQLSAEAENAARIAKSFPKIQFESYLDLIKDNDRNLYLGLVREHQMDMDTHRLAMSLREAQTRTEQERITNQLRERLDEIFILKQKNRGDEIEKLTWKLDDLQNRIKERESLRKEIVESRLRELLEQHRW